MKRYWRMFFVTLMILVFWVGSAQAGSVFKLLEDIEIHGFASSSYSYNFNEPVPQSNCGRTGVCLRIFDQDDNSFKFDVGELVILREAATKGDIGFRVDLDYGFSIPEVTGSTGDDGIGGPDDDFDVQQAYVSYIVPIGNGLAVDFGKFITHIGSEVIEGHDGYNYNFSRSFLFGLAIPFTHTGLRATYAINDKISVLAMVANGWDNVDEDRAGNDGKTFGLQLAVNPLDNVSILLNWAGGDEGGSHGVDEEWRNIFDLVVEIGILDNLTFNLNFDYGFEDNRSPINPDTDAEWWGIAGIVRYDVNDWFSINVRAEYFDDEDGYRTFGDDCYAGVSEGEDVECAKLDPADHELWEITITPEIRVNKNMVVRFEYRHDESNLPVFFTDELGVFDDDQDTFSFNALIFF